MSIDPKFVELTADVLEILCIYIREIHWGLHVHVGSSGLVGRPGMEHKLLCNQRDCHTAQLLREMADPRNRDVRIALLERGRSWCSSK